MNTILGILTIFRNPEEPMYKNKLVSAPFQQVKLSVKAKCKVLSKWLLWTAEVSAAVKMQGLECRN